MIRDTFFENYFKKGIRINRILFFLVTSTPFIAITIMANGLVLFFSSTFYYIEAATNDKVQSFLDALWWGYATATTVGYGDIIPVTPTGKILGIILMVSGTALFATYTALFANAILEDEMIKFNIYPKKKSTDDILKMLDKHKRDLEEHISDLNAQNNSDT